MLKKLLAMMLVVLVVAVSCKKDEDDPVTETDKKTPPVQTQVEKDKETIETAGTEMVTELESLKDDPSVKTTTSFISFMGKSDFGGAKKIAANNRFFKVLYNVNKFAEGDADLFDIFDPMKSLKKGEGDEPSGPQDIFNEVKGTYIWTPDSSDWVYTSGGTSIVFEFPSTETGTTNDAKLTVTYSGHTILDTTMFDGYDGDIPAAVNASIIVGTTKVIEFSFNATFDNDDIPSKVETSLALGTFVFAIDLINTTSAVSLNYSFKHGTKILLDIGVGADGNFDLDNIQTIADDTTSDYDDIDDIVTSVNAHFQILTVKLSGIADVDGFITDIQALDNQGGDVDEDDILAKVNSRLNLALYKTSDNSKIADIEGYFHTVTDTYSIYEWDDATQTYKDVEYTDEYEELAFRFLFPDGTKTDAETYFENGFSDLETAVEDFIADLDAEFGDGN